MALFFQKKSVPWHHFCQCLTQMNGVFQLFNASWWARINRCSSCLSRHCARDQYSHLFIWMTVMIIRGLIYSTNLEWLLSDQIPIDANLLALQDNTAQSTKLVWQGDCWGVLSTCPISCGECSRRKIRTAQHKWHIPCEEGFTSRLLLCCIVWWEVVCLPWSRHVQHKLQ